MKVAAVDLGDRSYNIFIHRGSLESVGQMVGEFNLTRRCLLVTNDTVGQIYGEQVEESLKLAGFEVKTAVVEDGEGAKSLPVAEQLYREAYSFRMERSSPVIALGGGVVGDLAGFLAWRLICVGAVFSGSHFFACPGGQQRGWKGSC